MKAIKITVKPFEFVTFTKIEINKRAGEHATAYIEGHISADKNNDYIDRFVIGTGATVECYDTDGQADTLLNGMVADIRIIHANDVKVLAVKIISWSAKMDMVRHIRTFQDNTMTYKQVTDIMYNESGEGNIIVPEYNAAPIGSMFVQYNETDWAFAKRMASRLGVFVFTDCKLDIPYIAMGMTASRSKDARISADRYEIKKDIGEFLDIANHGVTQYSERDAMYYEVCSRDIFGLCDSVPFDGLDTYVFAIESQLEGGELVHKYTLKEKSGFKTRAYFNDGLAGASLSGTVAEVNKDMVKINVDGDVKEKTHKWFAFSTVYSSPDNTGWYFMPEANDAVRLHFPSSREDEAYVISAVHSGGREGADIKSIRTRHGKAVVFAPGYILITNGKGSSVRLDDESGIALDTDKDISLSAAEGVSIESKGQVKITGESNVTMNQSGNQINVAENIDITGGHVRIR